MNRYAGQQVQVTGSVQRAPGDVLVYSRVTGGERPAEVLWRVLRSGDGRWRAVDVQVAGIWLAVTQQQDFVSTLDNNRGDINVLINQLQGRA